MFQKVTGSWPLDGPVDMNDLFKRHLSNIICERYVLNLNSELPLPCFLPSGLFDITV